MKNHEHELATSMTEVDWLRVYSSAVNDYSLDMNQMIHRTRHPEKYADDLRTGLSQEQIL